MSADEPTSLLVSAVQETLDAFVAPRVRNALIADALRAGGLSRLPSSPGDVRCFVEGPLRDIAARALGDELADSIAAELQRVVESAQQLPAQAPLAPTERPPGRPARETLTPARRSFSPPPAARRSFTPRSGTLDQSFIRRQDPAGGSAMPLVSPSEYFRRVNGGNETPRKVDVVPAMGSTPSRVLAASFDPSLIAALTHWLDGRASVEVMRSLFTLIHTIEATVPNSLLIVLDMASPSVRPESLAALAEDLVDVRIVLVRSSESAEQRLIEISPRVSEWRCFRAVTAVEDIASTCACLVR